jgi:hypothetical protein
VETASDVLYAGVVPVLHLAFVMTAFGCNPASTDDPAISERAGEGAGASATATGEAPETDPLLERVRLAARDLVPQMAQTDTVVRGRLDQGEFGDYQLILLGDNCYAIVSASTDDLVELDLALYDPNGVLRDRSIRRTGAAALGVAHSLCPPFAGNYRLRVRALDGSGEFVVRVYE